MDLIVDVGFKRPFFMVQSADHITGATGLTITATISKDGAAFGSPTGTITELANGWYYIDLDAADVDTLGALAMHFTATGADPTDFADLVVPAPQTYPANFDLLVIDSNGRVEALVGMTQNIAFANFQFKMSDSTGAGVTGLVNGDFSIKDFSIGGGANGTLSGTITEDPGGNGFYLISLLAAELNGRSVALTFLATGTITTQLTLITSQ